MKTWRWWVALIPVAIVLATLHAVAAICDWLSDVLEWLAHRIWRVGCYRTLQLTRAFKTSAHGWIFKLPEARHD